MGFAVAAKSFIVLDGKLLLLKRRTNDVHRPGKCDIPGGRLELGESPFDGIKRETMEETGIDIDIVAPLEIQHFTRDDGQRITMIIFLCTPNGSHIKLSEEHTEYKWEDISSAEQDADWLRKPVSNFKKYYEGKI